ncbi:hypothetical protein [Arcticibacter tournemirensis]
MKNLNLIALVFAVLLFGCKEDEVQPESLIGTWELRHVLGGQIAGAPSDFPKGNGKIIQFSADEYQRIEDGKVVSTGTYRIVKESAEIDGTKYEQRIIFDDDQWKTFIRLTGNKILICSGTIAADGTTATYEKIITLE